VPAEYEVVPHVGIGPVRLGMTRAESRAAIGVEARAFMKDQADTVPTEAFHDASFQVFYDASERVEYIELSKSPEIEPIVFGEKVLQLRAEDAVGLVERHVAYDDSNPELGYSYVFPALELALWRPVVPESEDDEEGRTFSTVGVGVSGYFST
jgi:hypothetical protein